MREAYSKIKSVASKFKEVELLPYEDLVPDNGESLYDLFGKYHGSKITDGIEMLTK